jgi:hypothetical protein
MVEEIWLDRVVAEDLVDSLRPGGAFRPLVEFRGARQQIMDLQFRRPTGRVSRVSLYAGLTRPLDLDARIFPGGGPEFRFHVAHDTHRRAALRYGYEAWSSWQPQGELANRWPQVARYLVERERWFESEPAALHHVIEGRVHAAMCRDGVSGYRVINREASPSFRDMATKAEVCGRIRAEIRRVLDGAAEPKPWLRYYEFGTSPDILAVDGSGRVVVAEAKPRTYTSGIVRGPIQARFYAGLISRWLQVNPHGPDLLAKMLEQRIEVGLTPDPLVSFGPDVTVVPVLAIGAGQVPTVALEHAVELRDALLGLDQAEAGGAAATEIWRLDADGNVEEVL